MDEGAQSSGHIIIKFVDNRSGMAHELVQEKMTSG